MSHFNTTSYTLYSRLKQYKYIYCILNFLNKTRIIFNVILHYLHIILTILTLI